MVALRSQTSRRKSEIVHEEDSVGPALGQYVQFSVLTIGLYASRFHIRHLTTRRMLSLLYCKSRQEH